MTWFVPFSLTIKSQRILNTATSRSSRDNKKSVLIASLLFTPSLLSPFPTNATRRSKKKKMTWSFHVCASFFSAQPNTQLGVQFGVFFHPLKTANSERIQATFVFVCVFIAIHSLLISSFQQKKSIIIAISRLRGSTTTKKCTENLFLTSVLKNDKKRFVFCVLCAQMFWSIFISVMYSRTSLASIDSKCTYKSDWLPFQSSFFNVLNKRSKNL